MWGTQDHCHYHRLTMALLRFAPLAALAATVAAQHGKSEVIGPAINVRSTLCAPPLSMLRSFHSQVIHKLNGSMLALVPTYVAPSHSMTLVASLSSCAAWDPCSRGCRNCMLVLRMHIRNLSAILIPSVGYYYSILCTCISHTHTRVDHADHHSLSSTG